MTAIQDCFEPVGWFQAQMLRKLASEKNQRKGSWLRQNRWELLLFLRREVDELNNAMVNGESSESIIKEAADVANLAMMVADWERTYESPC